MLDGRHAASPLLMRSCLSCRAQATFIFLAAKDEACDWLRQRSETAGRCLRGHREAFDFLSSMAQACIERELARSVVIASMWNE